MAYHAKIQAGLKLQEQQKFHEAIAIYQKLVKKKPKFFNASNYSHFASTKQAAWMMH